MIQYDQPVFRPPSEAHSLIIQAVIGCPHNACAFCDMYKSKRFFAKPQEEIYADLNHARRMFGPGERTLFLADGNAIVLSTDRLAGICEKAGELFPNLRRITTYGSAKFVIKKKPEDFKRLAEAGLTRIHMGLETGDPETLRIIDKGVEPDTFIKAGKMVMDAGIELSLYVMVGIAGMGRWREHAIESARIINSVSPTFVRLRTFVPRQNTPMYDAWKTGKITLPDPYEAMAETRLFVENIETETIIRSDHRTNFLDVSGKFPDQKEVILEKIDDASRWPRSRFRPDTAKLIHWGL